MVTWSSDIDGVDEIYVGIMRVAFEYDESNIAAAIFGLSASELKRKFTKDSDSVIFHINAKLIIDEESKLHILYKDWIFHVTLADSHDCGDGDVVVNFYCENPDTISTGCERVFFDFVLDIEDFEQLEREIS